MLLSDFDQVVQLVSAYREAVQTSELLDQGGTLISVSVHINSPVEQLVYAAVYDAPPDVDTVVPLARKLFPSAALAFREAIKDNALSIMTQARGELERLGVDMYA